MRRLIERKIVVASHNKGKLAEIGVLLAPFGINAVSAVGLGLTEPEETEDNFAGNARIKAHYAAKNSKLPALSDDSGIQVDALGGAPGVHTAGWAETKNGRDFPMAMHKVWDKLEQLKAPEPRNAHFVCMLCLAWPDGDDQVFEGRISGRLVWPMRGNLGFGFDPVFLPDGYDVTFGEMDPAEKHRISHRAQAFSKFKVACLDG